MVLLLFITLPEIPPYDIINMLLFDWLPCNIECPWIPSVSFWPRWVHLASRTCFSWSSLDSFTYSEGNFVIETAQFWFHKSTHTYYTYNTDTTYTPECPLSPLGPGAPSLPSFPSLPALPGRPSCPGVQGVPARAGQLRVGASRDWASPMTTNGICSANTTDTQSVDGAMISKASDCSFQKYSGIYRGHIMRISQCEHLLINLCLLSSIDKKLSISLSQFSVYIQLFPSYFPLR